MRPGLIVMSVPERRHLIAPLRERLGHFILYVDERREHNVWGAARKCWLAGLASSFDHWVVLHDDAWPCADFAHEAGRAIRALPDQPLSFFCHVREAWHTRATEGGYLALNNHAAGTALCLPRGLIREFVQWCDDHTDPAWIMDDTRMLCWCCATGRMVHHTIPSLVQHKPGEISVARPGRDNSDLAAPRWMEYPRGVQWSADRVLALPSDARSYLISRRTHLRGEPWQNLGQ